MDLGGGARLLVALAASAGVACRGEENPPELADLVFGYEAGPRVAPPRGGARDAGREARGDDPSACGDPRKGDLVIPYPGTSGAMTSVSFTLTVNCQPVFVEYFGGVSYAHFAFAGTAHVAVTSTFNAGSYTLSPTSSGISSSVAGAVRTFNLTVPRNLLLWDKSTGINLAIFADSLEDETYSPGAPGVVDVASCGVASDGTEVATTKLQAALDAVATTPGGGVLYFGPGTYATGSLRIGSFTTVYLAPGATLRGTGVPSHYPPDADISNGVSGKQSAGPQFYQLEFDDAQSSRLIGRGTVDMNGTLLRDMDGPAGRLLQIKNSTDIEVRDVILRDPSSWNTQILASDGVTLSNVRVINDNTSFNTDGIDPDSSRNVLVDGAFVYSGDDGFAIKSSGSYLGLAPDPSDIVIRNSTVFSFETALKMGTESQAATTERVTFENDDVVAAVRAVGVYVKDGSNYRSCAWRAIRVENIVISGAFAVPYPYNESVGSGLIEIGINQRFPGTPVGSVEGVFFEDFQAPGGAAQAPSILSGFDETHEVSGVTFRDLTVGGTPVGSVDDLEAVLNAFVSPPTFAFTPYGFGEPTVYVTASALYASPGSPGIFTFGRLGNTESDLRIDFTVTGAAVSGADYAAIPSHVVLAAGRATTTLSVTPFQAGVPDPQLGGGLPPARPARTVRLSLVSSPTWQYLLGPSYQAVVTFTP